MSALTGKLFHVEVLCDAPWDRQPGESAPAFEAFCEYRNAGPRRSLRQVAVRLGKSSSLIYRWSSAHGWVRRAREWDFDQAAVEHGDDPKAKAARLVRTQRLLQDAMGAVALPAAELTRRIDEDPDLLERRDVRELLRWVLQFSRVMPSLVKAELALLEEYRVSAHDADLFEKERARREVLSWSPEQRDAYLREAGVLADDLEDE